jgi:hypothetical protein
MVKMYITAKPRNLAPHTTRLPLARFVPPPRVHRHRHRRVLAPNLMLRVVVGAPQADLRFVRHPARGRTSTSSRSPSLSRSTSRS